MEHNCCNSDRFQVDCKSLHDHIHRGFAGSIKVAAATAIVSNAAHFAGDSNDGFLLTTRDLCCERFGHFQWRHGINAECLDPFRIIRMAKSAFIRIRVDSGVVDKQIYGFIGQHLRQAVDLYMICNIKRMDIYPFRMLCCQFVQRI